MSSNIYKSLISNFFLNFSPHLTNTTGTGRSAKATNASNVFPQPSPSLTYIGCPASGSTAPMILRITVLAASAEAAYTEKASTR